MSLAKEEKSKQNLFLSFRQDYIIVKIRKLNPWENYIKTIKQKKKTK